MIVVLVNNIFLALASFVPRGRGIKEEAPLSVGEENDEPIWCVMNNRSTRGVGCLI